ncbi:MAG: EAL domain-containing protein [Clostridia bacterium]|nr:EAL domain-containing protein [Clostridia bacterium]
MDYEYGYAICSLAFLLVVEVHFFRKKRYPSLQNKIYEFVMLFALGDLVLDIVGSYTIVHALAFPHWVNYAINIPFYIMQVLLPATLMIYVLAIAEAFSKKNSLSIKLLFLPAIFITLFILSTRFTGAIFRVDSLMGYIRGSFFYLLYAASGFYFILTLCLLVVLRKRFSKIEFITIFMFIVLCLIGIAIQYIFPHYLLTSMVLALSITMMFFVIQMPEYMLDVTTGTFNYNALLRYLDETIKRERKLVGFAVSTEEFLNNNEHLSFSVINQIAISMANYLSAISYGAWIFRVSGNVYVVLTEDEEHYKKTVDDLYRCSTLKMNMMGSEVLIPFRTCVFDDNSLVASSSNFVRLLEITFEEAKMKGSHSIIKLDSRAKNSFNRYIQIESGMKEELESEGFHLNFQPVYAIKENRFLTAEALLRFTHPTLGEISPEEFIPIAEKNGTILKIDLHVLKKVCRFIKKHDLVRQFGLDMIAVNFSTLDLMQENFCDIIIKTIEEEGVDFHSFGLEITESAATKLSDRAIRGLEDLRDKGIRILLDDFGSGYSNLQKITKLPLYAIKIDRSMFSAYVKGSASAIVFEDIIKMCRRLKLLIIVEGANSKEDVETLLHMDIDKIQGFYYSKPLSEEDYIKRLQKG